MDQNLQISQNHGPNLSLMPLPRKDALTLEFSCRFTFKWASPPPNSPCPSKPLGEEMELISLPLENVSHTLHPRYEFGWDELHLAREPQEPGPPPEMNFYDFMIVAAVTGGCLNPHDCG